MRPHATFRPALIPALALVLAVAATAAVPSAHAQVPSGADCAKAPTAAEKGACMRARQFAAEKEMTAAYDRLAQTLAPNARNHLRADQDLWHAAHTRMCSTPTIDNVTTDAPLGVQECILSRTQRRTELLRIVPVGNNYPFISDRARAETGSIPGIRYGFSASYPSFDRPGLNYSAVNARLSQEANDLFEKPGADDVVKGQTQRWSRELDYTLVFPTPTVVTIIGRLNVYLGGAHPHGAHGMTIVDIPSGRVILPQDIFTPGYVDTILPMVQADLRAQFRQQPGFDEALEPAKLRKLLRDDQRWIVRGEEIEIVFNTYEVGPYVSGPYSVSLPYKRIAAMIRRDGPLASKIR